MRDKKDPALQFKNILVTGGLGFIGSCFIRQVLADPGFSGRIINLDLCTYASWSEIKDEFQAQYTPERYVFVQGSIADQALVSGLFGTHCIDCVVNFAAESHVDQSIASPGKFLESNVQGVYVLLEAARAAWAGRSGCRFHQVGTDEVYGSLAPDDPESREDSPCRPRSPYAATKTSADHLVMAWHHTYGLPVSISRACNNYGPWQHLEKFIPLMVSRLGQDMPCPIYGDGLQVRDWMYVGDHVRAIRRILESGLSGMVYNVGAGNGVTNRHLFGLLCEAVAVCSGKEVQQLRNLAQKVQDRPGHDRRYAMDSSLIRDGLQWQPETELSDGIKQTVAWYWNRTQVNRSPLL